jgi:hypothetical protein
MRQVLDYGDPWYGQKEIIVALATVSGLLALPLGFEMVLLEFFLNLIVTVISIYSMAFLLWLVGKLFGGKSTIAELSAAMTWPMAPAIAGTLLVIPLTGLEPLGDILQGLFYLFSFHLMVETVAEVEQFSKWKSFFSQLLALILSALPFLIFWQQISDSLRTLVSF